MLGAVLSVRRWVLKHQAGPDEIQATRCARPSIDADVHRWAMVGGETSHLSIDTRSQSERKAILTCIGPPDESVLEKRRSLHCCEALAQSVDESAERPLISPDAFENKQNDAFRRILIPEYPREGFASYWLVREGGRHCGGQRGNAKVFPGVREGEAEIGMADAIRKDLEIPFLGVGHLKGTSRDPHEGRESGPEHCDESIRRDLPTLLVEIGSEETKRPDNEEEIARQFTQGRWISLANGAGSPKPDGEHDSDHGGVQTADPLREGSRGRSRCRHVVCARRLTDRA